MENKKDSIRNANWFIFICFDNENNTSSISGWSKKKDSHEALAEVLAEFIIDKPSLSGYTIKYSRCINLNE